MHFVPELMTGYMGLDVTSPYSLSSMRVDRARFNRLSIVQEYDASLSMPTKVQEARPPQMICKNRSLRS